MKPRPVVTILEIYRPGSRSETIRSYEFAGCMMSIRQGDLISPYEWWDEHPTVPLRVVDVHHLVCDHETEIKHVVMVFTEKAELACVPTWQMMGGVSRE